LKLAHPHLDVLRVTGDLESAVCFWRDVTQLVVEEIAAGHATLRVGEQRLRLAAPHPAPPRAPGGLYAGAGYRVLGLIVDDLEAVCRRIAARGRRVTTAPDLPGRWPIRFARDADGNMLELIGRPASAPPLASDRLQVGLTVADATRIRRFYGETLALPEQAPAAMGGGMVRHAFSVGRSTLKLWARPEPLPRLSGPPGDAIGIRAVTLQVADPVAVRRALSARGVPVADDAHLSAAASSSWIADPEGNWIELRPAG